MTSKELNEILNKTRRTKNIELSVEQVEEIIKDLEDYEELKKIMGTPIQEISEKLKKLEYYENEKYKHWNIFFNGAKLEYLLYLEKKGKESFMASISEELFSKIKEHFSDENGA